MDGPVAALCPYEPRQAWTWPLAAMPYALLTLLVAVTVMLKRTATGSLAIDLVLCGLVVLWMLWMVTLHPAWRGRPRVMAAFVAVIIAFTMIMVLRDPWFGFFTIAGYTFAFRLLPRPWQLPGVAGVAVTAGTAQASGIPKNTLIGVVLYLAIVAANVVPMCALALLNRRASQQSEDRERALAQLSEANRRLEETLAENAGLHEQLLAQAREAGVLDERQRMAREIHDTLAQGLAGIITQLQAAERSADDRPAWLRHVGAATGLARESLSEARRSVHELRPEPLRLARLGDALSDVAERWSTVHAIAVQVTTTGTVRPMPPEAETALLRAVQEALANVAKHADATRVGVTLSYLEHEVAVDVRDDGRGFVPTRLGDATPVGGFGLLAMRQRIEGLHGTVQIESEPGAGAGISARVPLAHPGVPE